MDFLERIVKAQTELAKELERIVKAQTELAKEKEAMLSEIQEALQKIKRELRVQKGSRLGKVLFLIKYTKLSGLRLSKIRLTDDDTSTIFSFVLPDGREISEISDHKISVSFIKASLKKFTMKELQELLDSLVNEGATEENVIIEAKEI